MRKMQPETGNQSPANLSITLNMTNSSASLNSNAQTYSEYGILIILLQSGSFRKNIAKWIIVALLTACCRNLWMK